MTQDSNAQPAPQDSNAQPAPRQSLGGALSLRLTFLAAVLATGLFAFAASLGGGGSILAQPIWVVPLLSTWALFAVAVVGNRRAAQRDTPEDATRAKAARVAGSVAGVLGCILLLGLLLFVGFLALMLSFGHRG